MTLVTKDLPEKMCYLAIIGISFFKITCVEIIASRLLHRAGVRSVVRILKFDCW